MTPSIDRWTKQNEHIGVWGGFKEIRQSNFFGAEVIPSLVFCYIKRMDFFQLVDV